MNAPILEIGDKELLQCTAFKGKHKISDHWDKVVYHVQKQPYKNMPVFTSGQRRESK